jgi:hypothetical protein
MCSEDVLFALDILNRKRTSHAQLASTVCSRIDGSNRTSKQSVYHRSRVLGHMYVYKCFPHMSLTVCL